MSDDVYNRSEKINILSDLRDKIVNCNDELQITIVPTMECNFRCVYCYENNTAQVVSKESLDGLLCFIRNKGKKYRSIRISWFGGEPLLCLDLIIEYMGKIREICRTIGIPVVGHVTTNGSLLTAKAMISLYKVKVLFYQITIDGVSFQNINRPMKSGDNSYDVVMKNLKDICRLPQRNFQIGIRTNLSRDNLAEIGQLLDEFKHYFQGDGRFVFMLHRICNWGGDRISDSSINLLSSKEYRFWEARFKMRAQVNGLCWDDSEEVMGGYICSYVQEGAFILGADGLIYKCTLCMGNPNEAIGTITREGMLDCSKRRPAEMRDISTCIGCWKLKYCLGVPCQAHSGCCYEE